VTDRGRWGRGGDAASVVSVAAATATAGTVAVPVCPAYGTLKVVTPAADAVVAATPALSDASTAFVVFTRGAFAGDEGDVGTGSANMLLEEETVLQAAVAGSGTCETQGGCR